MTSIKEYLQETSRICQEISIDDIQNLIKLIKSTKHCNGRIFIAAVGGSAANASHAVNDFRKIINIETHSLTENVSELTARINDDGWESSLVNTIKTFKPHSKDLLVIFSVGGGSETTSKNLVEVMKFCKEINCQIASIVSRDGGYAKKISDVCVLIPVINNDRITPHAEEMQAVIWHLIVSLLGEK